MYCPSCGKNIPDGSRFCLHCGSAIASSNPASETPIEWEYDDYVTTWEKGKYKAQLNDINGGEATIRLTWWNQCQSWIRPEIQKWLDKGWQPITEVGPSGFGVRRHPAGFLGWPYLELTEFRVKMRRPKKK